MIELEKTEERSTVQISLAEQYAMTIEEAAAYFSGDKTKQEVIDVIQKRVQLFLAED